MTDNLSKKPGIDWTVLVEGEIHNNPTEPQTGDEVGEIIDWDFDFEIIDEVKEDVVLPARFQHTHSWKVRESYENPDNPEQLILIATDRISTHDVVHDSIVPWKWESLTQISNFWFNELKNEYKTNHIRSHVVENPVWPEDFPEELKARSVIVKKLKALPVEAIVRQYLFWSALGWYNKETWLLATWEDIWKWLQKCSKFENPRFTPSTKSDWWDINVSFDVMVWKLKEWLVENNYKDVDAFILAKRIEGYSTIIYNHANKIAQEKWIIIWDTKFEFWLDDEWNLYVIDELVTPDSSRFWKQEWFEEWKEPESYDKQPVRDYVIAFWKSHPERTDKNWKHYWEEGFKWYPIELSPQVIEACQERYIKMKIAFS